jgi:YesN/AraC family two-component response regulator
MKLTPMQYIISQKISNAMQLFDKTNLNVNQVARAVGYEDYRYFSRIFKKRTGFSPLEYKKKQKNH